MPQGFGYKFVIIVAVMVAAPSSLCNGCGSRSSTARASVVRKTSFHSWVGVVPGPPASVLRVVSVGPSKRIRVGHGSLLSVSLVGAELSPCRVGSCSTVFEPNRPCEMFKPNGDSAVAVNSRTMFVRLDTRFKGCAPVSGCPKVQGRTKSKSDFRLKTAAVVILGGFSTVGLGCHEELSLLSAPSCRGVRSKSESGGLVAQSL